MSETYDIIFLILSSPVWWYFCHNFPFAHATNAQYIFPTVALGSRAHFRAVKQKKINDFYITVIYPIPEDFLCVGPSVWLILYFSSWRTSFNVSCGKAVPLFWWFVRCSWSLPTWAGLHQMLCLWAFTPGSCDCPYSLSVSLALGPWFAPWPQSSDGAKKTCWFWMCSVILSCKDMSDDFKALHVRDWKPTVKLSNFA